MCQISIIGCKLLASQALLKASKEVKITGLLLSVTSVTGSGTMAGWLWSILPTVTISFPAKSCFTCFSEVK